MKGFQRETGPFPGRLVPLKQVHSIAQNSKQPEFYVEKKKETKPYPLFTEGAFGKPTRMLAFARPAATGGRRRRRDAQACAGRHADRRFGVSAAGLPAIPAGRPSSPLSKKYGWNFLTVTECQQHYREPVRNRLSTFRIS